MTATAPNRFNRAKKFLENKGFRLRAGNLTGQSDYYRSGTIKQRANELNALIRDPSVRCIMSVIGGMNSNSLLPYLDYQALTRDPKIVIGYSDATALLAGIFARTGLVTFYGPALVASFGEFPPLVEETFNVFSDLLVDPSELPYHYQLPSLWTDERLNWDTEHPVRPKVLYQNNCHFVGAGRIEGRVIGGNLNTLSSIMGTPWMPEVQRGDILFIEDSLKDIATVERLFSLLKLSGILDKVSAVILGKHELFDDAGSGRRPSEVLQEVMADHQLPLVDGFDCCHTHPMLTLPLGVTVCIDFDRRDLSITGQYWQKKADSDR